jgi:hypothetical protein
MVPPERNVVSAWSALSGSSTGQVEGGASSTVTCGRDTRPRGSFQGVTANGLIEPGLFAIRSTGVSTAPIRHAAEAFLGVLTQARRDKTLFPVDDPERRKWMNQSFCVRQGVSFLDMTSEQRDKAFGLLRDSLSARGLKQTRDIMRLNETLAKTAGV